MRGKSEKSNFYSHWLRIKIEGFRLERLISQIIEKDIRLKHIVYISETEVQLSISEESFRKVKKMTGSRYRLTVIKEGGGRPAIWKIRNSKMAAAGAAIFLLLFFAQSFFVREINIIGCRSITEDSIRKTLKEEGLYEGGLKDFDANDIEWKLFKEYDSIVWARVSYEGNFALVEISETRQAKAKKLNPDMACNIVASQDCYIENILTYKGKSVVKTDDFVRKGGILITGTLDLEHPSFEPEKDEATEYYVHAAGKITARVPYYFSFYMEPPEEKSRAETEIRSWIKENVPENAQILNKDFHFDKKKNIIRVYGTIETRQQVGIEKEIVIDKHKRRAEKDSD